MRHGALSYSADLFNTEGYIHQVDDAVAGVQSEAFKLDLFPWGGGNKTGMSKSSPVLKTIVPFFHEIKREIKKEK